jgi:ABC-type nitrate/sulfonate/bicarbonate transport system ATPase subunit
LRELLIELVEAESRIIVAVTHHVDEALYPADGILLHPSDRAHQNCFSLEFNQASPSSEKRSEMSGYREIGQQLLATDAGRRLRRPMPKHDNQIR